jgi:hypothetical protein
LRLIASECAFRRNLQFALIIARLHCLPSRSLSLTTTHHFLSQHHYRTCTSPRRQSNMPDINDFPNELLVEIFSHFDLKTLTRCMRVNKSFKAITEHSAFDKVFWRTKAVKLGEPINLDQLHVNPIFRKLTYICRKKIKDVYFLLCDEKPDGVTDYRELALIDSSAAKQNATEPAVPWLYISPYGYDDMVVQSEHAVTVEDVMQGLCDYYGPCVGYNSCHYWFEGFDKSAKSTEGELILEGCWGS